MQYKISNEKHIVGFFLFWTKSRSQDCSSVYPLSNIYNKLLKDEIQIKILYKFLDELERIEKGNKINIGFVSYWYVT